MWWVSHRMGSHQPCPQLDVLGTATSAAAYPHTGQWVVDGGQDTPARGRKGGGLLVPKDTPQLSCSMVTAPLATMRQEQHVAAWGCPAHIGRATGLQPAA